MPTSRERTPPPRRAFHPPSEVAERILAAYRAAASSSTDATPYAYRRNPLSNTPSDIAGDSDGDDNMPTASALERRIEANRVSNEMQMYMQQQQITKQQEQLTLLRGQLEQQRMVICVAIDLILRLYRDGEA